MAAPDLMLSIGRATVAASDTAAVAAAITTANQQAAVEGVPDGFNPATIDPAKAQALLAALAKAPLAALAGRNLILNAYNLRIGTSSPTTPASFTGAVRLEIDSEHGASVMANVLVAPDCATAIARAAAARELTAAADAEVNAATGDAVMPARRRRQAVSRVWFDNAAAQATCQPSEATAAERAAAEKAMKAAIVIGGAIQ